MRDELLVGWADIAAALRRDVRLVKTWGHPLGWDPLPVAMYADRVEIRRSQLDAWHRRNMTDGAGEERLYRMPAIAARAQMSVRSAFAAASAPSAPLPVQHEAPGPLGGIVWAYASAIDDYRLARTHSLLVRRFLSSKLVTLQKAGKGVRWRKGRRWPATVTAAEVRSAAEPEAATGDPARSASQKPKPA